jgi:acyl carrier protein
MEYDADRTKIYEIVKDAIMQVAESSVICEIRPDSELRQLGLDSLVMIELPIAIEEKVRKEYKIKNFVIPDDAMEKINTVDDAVQALYNSLYGGKAV